jgi:(p)ppGpp synthase/HD superfamily hydrolase
MTYILKDAFDFARDRHAWMKDDSGKDYFDSHLLGTVDILKRLGASDILLSAAVLHDTLEDTETTLDELENKFGKRVAKLVLMVTHAGSKDAGHYFPNLKAGTLTNGWVASREDYRDAVLIKFADRLSNLSRMDCWDDKRVDAYLKKSKFWSNEQVKEKGVE